MSTKKRYSIEFKEQALRRVFTRGERTISNVAADLNMTSTTLKDWMKAQRKVNSTPKAAAAYSPADRLLALQKKRFLYPKKRFLLGAASKACLSPSLSNGVRTSFQIASRLPLETWPVNCVI